MEEKLISIFNIILTKKQKPEIRHLDKHLNLRTDLDFDSLDLAELTVRIEDEFGIDIFEDSIVTDINEIMNKLK